MSAPSKDLFEDFTLSISRFISMIFFEVMGFDFGSTLFSNLCSPSFLFCSTLIVFLTVVLVEGSKGFFLKSVLLIFLLLGAEYFVFTYLVSLCEAGGTLFSEYLELKVFFF